MADTNEASPRKLTVRKYPNRRYYDATRSRHVTLEELHELIRDGCEIEVTDSKTGQDITGKVLAQIILDLDPPKLEIFSVPMLHRLIRSNEQLVRDFIDRYLNQAVSAFLDSQRQFEAYLRQSMGLHTGAGAMGDWTRAMFNPFAAGMMFPGMGPFAGTGSRPEAAAGQEAAELRAQVEELRRQVEALTRQGGVDGDDAQGSGG